jgi:hypothetical protein
MCHGKTNRVIIKEYLYIINKNFKYYLDYWRFPESYSLWLYLKSEYIQVVKEQCKLLQLVVEFEDVLYNVRQCQYYINSMWKAVKNKPDEELNQLKILLCNLVIAVIFFKRHLQNEC